jgi:hypothetical protein
MNLLKVAHSLHVGVSKINQARNQQKRNQRGKISHGAELTCKAVLLVSCLDYSSTVKMEVICHPKRRAVSELHDITTQKALFLKVIQISASHEREISLTM